MELLDEIEAVRGALEAEGTTGFALKMIHKTAENREFAFTAWTVVGFLCMSRAAEVLVELVELCKSLATEVASIPATVPCCFRSNIRRWSIVVIVPFNLFICEDVVPVHLPAVLVDSGSIDAGCTVTGLQMNAHARKIGEHPWTEWAFHVVTDMDR